MNEDFFFFFNSSGQPQPIVQVTGTSGTFGKQTSMSQAAIMQATIETLRKNLGLTETQVDAVPEGEPHPTAPQVFYGVYDSTIRVNPIDYALDVNYGVNVAISVRLAHAPRDRKGGAFFLKQTTNIYRLAFQVIGSVQKSYDLLNLANQYIDDGGTGFGPEPLVLVGMSNVITKTGDWWGAEVEKEAGVALAISFHGARRIEYIPEIERTL